MNVGTNVFRPSQGVETGTLNILYNLGIREEIVDLVMNEFQSDTNLKEFESDLPSAKDETSDKILSDLRNGKAPVMFLLQELLNNNEFVSKDMNGLMLVMSSIFLNHVDYANILQEYISKLLEPDDTLYILLMISINKAEYLQKDKLLTNWQTTF